ncbi:MULTISPECIES: Uma2 family endonuclease [Thiorhodovibrio]|uniref:Uma2 family endonuclease n=1 Tax=Thiorhodovibrio TaxID=61593 RepID=UPI001911C22B|nr:MULTISPECIES: Uma2 family endonuclease [Thiorhodovibrio]MBK5968081.1 hypothetical protein [Thiorhodovibrio winogradskyi]WPL11898.1 hypothetical protein Thiosp_01651 [Thiorhodovibrio litoralis]
MPAVTLARSEDSPKRHAEGDPYFLDDAPGASESTEDHRVFLRDASWGDFETLLTMRGERSVPRMAFADGVIELMSPSSQHEHLKSLIGRLTEAYMLEQGIDFSPFGSWTLKQEKQQAGVEPDECYVLGHLDVQEAAAAKRPHLAIEVIWTSGGLNKLEIYRRLEVAEVWVWRRGELKPYVLKEGHYQLAEQSTVLPGIDLDRLAQFLDGYPFASAAIRAYRATLSAARF